MSQLVVVEFPLPVRFCFEGRVLPKTLAKSCDFSGIDLALPNGHAQNGKVRVEDGKVKVQLNLHYKPEATGCPVYASAIKVVAMGIVCALDPIDGVHRSLYASVPEPR